MFDRLRELLGHRISFQFVLAASVIIAVIFVLLFIWISSEQEKHIMDQVKKQAVILHKQVILTRRWVADHKAILVQKGPGVRSNPFLKEPDVTDESGKVYTKITASVLTKILSDRALEASPYYFRLTSTVPLNKANSPDAFENAAIERFRAKKTSGIYQTETRGGRPFLRYAAPVYVTQNCIDCHMTQGYKVGDVGGCLSVFVAMDEAKEAMIHNKAVLLGGSMLFAGSLGLLLYLLTQYLLLKRIKEISASVGRLRADRLETPPAETGDELKDIADFCYTMDEQLKNQHEELEAKIGDATRDLSNANRDLEALNKELQTLNQSKSDFFSDISHELRTPLTSIKGAVDILTRKASCEDPIYIEIIKRNTDHLIKTVVDFLDYSKMESGQLDLDFKTGSLTKVAEDAIFSQTAAATKKSIEIRLHADEDFSTEFDKTRMYQVFTNLLANAIHFSDRNTPVEVTLTSDNDKWIQVCVEDRGPGIDEKYHKSIFEKFYQIPDDTETKIHKGSSGIGLAICKGLVEAHGGTIWVESEPGQGARFFLKLPKKRA